MIIRPLRVQGRLLPVLVNPTRQEVARIPAWSLRGLQAVLDHREALWCWSAPWAEPGVVVRALRVVPTLAMTLHPERIEMTPVIRWVAEHPAVAPLYPVPVPVVDPLQPSGPHQTRRVGPHP